MASNTPAAPRFGVEEEFLLLDAGTGLPRDAAVELIAAVPGLRAEHEFFHSQIETATPICETAGDALASLGEFRDRASVEAERLGLVLAGTGLPPVGGDLDGTVTGKERYQRIARTMRGMVTRYYSTGTHVHVEVPSRDAGVDAMNRLARWSPVLVALTANSPIWLGADSGYASWRYLSILQWPSSGYPPQLGSAAEYDDLVDRLHAEGALLDAALVNWSVRLSDRYPTIELRTADAQLRSADAVDFALLLRAIVARGLAEYAAGEPCAPAQPDLLRGAHWLAARNGLASELVHPDLGVPRPAFDVVEALVGAVEAELRAAGDLDRVRALIDRRRADLGPAEVQRARWTEGGVRGLLELYR